MAPELIQRSAKMSGPRVPARAGKLLFLLLILCLPRLEAQSRRVQGTVLDSRGRPLKGAVVLLRPAHSPSSRSFLTTVGGRYSFAGLRSDVDYEISAHYLGHSSATTVLSRAAPGWITTINLVIDLR